MIATDCSTDDHVAESTDVYVESVTLAVSNVTMRRMDTMQTLVYD